MLNGNDDKLLPAVKIAPAKGVGCMAVLGRKAYCMAVYCHEGAYGTAQWAANQTHSTGLTVALAAGCEA